MKILVHFFLAYKGLQKFLRVSLNFIQSHMKVPPFQSPHRPARRVRLPGALCRPARLRRLGRRRAQEARRPQLSEGVQGRRKGGQTTI